MGCFGELPACEVAICKRPGVIFPKYLQGWPLVLFSALVVVIAVCDVGKKNLAVNCHFFPKRIFVSNILIFTENHSIIGAIIKPSEARRFCDIKKRHKKIPGLNFKVVFMVPGWDPLSHAWWYICHCFCHHHIPGLEPCRTPIMHPLWGSCCAVKLISTWKLNGIIIRKKRMYLVVSLCFQQTKPPMSTGNISRMFVLHKTYFSPRLFWAMSFVSSFFSPLAVLSVGSQPQFFSSMVSIGYYTNVTLLISFLLKPAIWPAVICHQLKPSSVMAVFEVYWCLRGLIFPPKTAITSLWITANSKKHLMKTLVHVRMVPPLLLQTFKREASDDFSNTQSSLVIQVSFQFPPQPEALHRWSRRQRLASDVSQSNHVTEVTKRNG